MLRNRKIEINRFNGIQKPPKGGFFYSSFLRPSQFMCVAVALIHSNVFYGQETLDKFVDGWHLSASKANLEEYFGATNETFVFLGTAPGERWSKKEFYAFSKPYFDRGKAWDFTPSNRKWNFNADSTVAWFDEDLATWMRGCRGSGVLVKENQVWKIAFYNLSVLIENEKMNAFIELRDKKN